MEAETAVEAEIEAAASPREEGDLLGGGRDEGASVDVWWSFWCFGE